MAKYHQSLKTWHIPLWEDQISLREAYDSLMSIGNAPADVPLMIKLAENPEFEMGGMGFFKGRVTLEQHDYIHIVLGRGLQLIDEAFTIGFTMGSTNRVSTFEKKLFSFLAGKVYPKPYRFTKKGTQVFKDATHLGYVSDCQPLDIFDFKPHLDKTLEEVRRILNLETSLLNSYYQIEAKRYPKVRASQRNHVPALH